MENWTASEDLLPLVGDDLLVLLDGETILRGRRMHNGWSAFFADGERSTGTRHVSHWMLLPPLPGAEQKQQPKMSRDEIAVAAMQGFVSNATYYQGYSPNEDFARQAVSMADALLKELSKP